MLRKLAERLSRGRSFRYRLPRKYGGCQMYLTPEAGLRYWLPRRAMRSDDNLLRNAAEHVKPGHVVWDVGANMGLFTFAAAGIAGAEGRIYAFEPDVAMVRLLRRSARLNVGTAPVEAIPCAVAEGVDLARFHIAERSRTSNALEGFVHTQTGGVREVETVMTVSLDWLAERITPPDVVKIDVEGADLSVLRGALHLMKTVRPVIVFEMTGWNWLEEAALFKSAGYLLYNSDLPAAKRAPLTEPTVNVLALPQ